MGIIAILRIGYEYKFPPVSRYESLIHVYAFAFLAFEVVKAELRAPEASRPASVAFLFLLVELVESARGVVEPLAVVGFFCGFFSR